jgi:hypothetical protein
MAVLHMGDAMLYGRWLSMIQREHNASIYNTEAWKAGNLTETEFPSVRNKDAE